MFRQLAGNAALIKTVLVVETGKEIVIATEKEIVVIADVEAKVGVEVQPLTNVLPNDQKEKGVKAKARRIDLVSILRFPPCLC